MFQHERFHLTLPTPSVVLCPSFYPIQKFPGNLGLSLACCDILLTRKKRRRKRRDLLCGSEYVGLQLRDLYLELLTAQAVVVIIVCVARHGSR